MPRIFDFGGREVERSLTVADLRALKGSGKQVGQVTAETAEEAAAAEAAGIEMVVCRGSNVSRVREGSRRVFVTAALGFAEAITGDEILRAGFAAVTAGADAVITGRSPDMVRLLANEQIPVMGHLGLVPRKSTWIGGMRAVGKTAREAMELWDRFRQLEDAGAFAAECEVIAAPVMEEINKRTSLVTVSLGSGPAADVIFLFTSDICGESTRLPRHARAWGNLRRLQDQIREERISALGQFRQAVSTGGFPAQHETASIPEDELARFSAKLDISEKVRPRS
jgi:3-methyl-2-oxobutanoate hydroxymethyltransferase